MQVLAKQSQIAVDEVKGVSQQRARLILAIGIVVYVVFFFYLAHLKLTSLTRHSGDVAGINNGFWYTFQGRFFYMYQMKMSWFGDKTGWLFLLVLPFYWLIPGPHTLIFISCVVIGLSAIPVYLLAVYWLRDRSAGLLFAGAYLLFPTIVSQTVNQIGMLQYVVTLVALALYFFLHERYRAYMICCLLALLLGTEDIGLTLMMFLPYGLIKRRGMKWTVVPVLCAVVWLVLTFKGVMPVFRGEKPYRALGYLANLGNSPGEIIHTLLLDPQRTFGSLFTVQNFFYLLVLLQPLLWVSPWFSWEMLFALPYLAINLLGENPSQKNVTMHYQVTVSLYLCLATIVSVTKWSAWLQQYWGRARYATGFGILYFVAAVMSWPLWLNLSDYQPRPYFQAQQAAMQLVPPGKSVVAPETMIAHLSDRERWATLNGIFLYTKEDLFSFDYLILDGNDRALEPWVTQEFVNKIASNPLYELVFSQQNVFVFRRR